MTQLGTALSDDNHYYNADMPPYLYSSPGPDGTQYVAYFYVAVAEHQSTESPIFQISFEIHEQPNYRN